MRGRALARRGLVQALALLAPFLAAERAHAEIRPRLLEGSVVFTSRPEQKPPADAEERGAGSFLRPATPWELDGLVRDVSRRYEMDPSLIATVIGVESGFNQMAVSPKGARGLMQLMPETARQYGVRDVHDPRENIEGGVAYLRDLMKRYNGDMKLALAAYNAGPEAVEKASGVPNFRETREYLRRIESRYGQKLTFSGMKVGGAAARGGTILMTRDENGEIVATNLRGTGVTLVPKKRKANP